MFQIAFPSCVIGSPQHFLDLNVTVLATLKLMNHLCFDASGPREVESLRNFVLEEAEKAARTKLEADRDL